MSSRFSTGIRVRPRFSRRERSAFTLIELLIVVAIIAILAAIAVPNFLEAQTRSKVGRCQTDMRSMGLAMEAYRIDFSKYPPVGWAGGKLGDPGWHASGTRPQLTTPIAYITSTPRDIFNKDKIWPDYCYFFYGRAYDTEPTMDMMIGDTPTARVRFWGMSPHICQWFLMSCGPCQQHCFDIFGNWNRETSYDPSNGTVSIGEILRTGP